MYLDRNFGLRLLLSESLSPKFEVWT